MMIEKINLNKRNSFGTLDWLEHRNEPSGAKLIAEKLNELVDAVNELQAQVAILEEHAHPTAKVDPYAEQRKWIGKLCRLWNFKDGAVDIGILKAIDNLKSSIPYISDIDCSYEFCEPVLPDDDIIYKGE